jgi:acetylornithine deacetylase/succinyl-diaminopimelate desuccinylase-like protein
MTAEPIAPHTVPGCVQVVVDVRLLPGHSPAEAVETVRAHLAAAGVAAQVAAGSAMLPAEVPPGHPLVLAMAAAAESVTGKPAAQVWSTNTFDAGYGCAHGIPTVMFGPGRRRFDAGITAAESVTLADCRAAADILAETISAICS